MLKPVNADTWIILCEWVGLIQSSESANRKKPQGRPVAVSFQTHVAGPSTLDSTNFPLAGLRHHLSRFLSMTSTRTHRSTDGPCGWLFPGEL
ncbi:hypothetical protein I79_002664 [Cricetulus griseus]|uniref:Uncharacterized protein n=1 Tax=Cricetulus griseus TaxID=10029 RepID=G3GY13_CRIGR|nr:hypothetical protein I79_002664 [Cricetulus griseus]